MSITHWLPTAGAAARWAHAQKRDGTSSTSARPSRRAAAGAAATALLLLACTAWALPGTLANDAPAAAAAAAADDSAGSGADVVAAGAALPQLAITLISVNDFLFSGFVALAGSTFAIVVSLSNTGQGNLKAKQAVLRVWSQDSASFPDRACGEAGNASVVLPAIQAGHSTSVYVSGIPAPSVVGTYTLRFFVDADCKVAENDESLASHQTTADYQVLGPSTALPSLGVRNRFYGLTVKAGKKLKVPLSLFNFGAVPSPPGLLALIVSSHTGDLTRSCAGLPEAGGTWTTLAPSTIIPVGNYIDITVTVPVPKISGQAALHIIINANCSIAEDTSISPLAHYLRDVLTVA